MGNQTPEIEVMTCALLSCPKTTKARDRVVAGLVEPSHVVELRLWFSAGARHRRRWASRQPGPQPALAGCALDPRGHGHAQ
jgi:hypothetical protein